MTPSNANTSGLEVVAWRWRFRTDGVWNYQEAQQRIPDVTCEPLVTAASAQARIAELESALAAAQNADAENDAHLRCRATAAEARADRLAKGIVQAEILIDDAIKGIQTAPLSVVTDTIWTADPCPMTVVEALQLARAALQQETQK